MKIEKDFLRNNDLGLLLLRLTIGGLMLFHGIHKAVHGVSFIEGMLEGMGLPGWIAYGAILGELVSSLLIIAGAWTRVAAVIFSGTMLVAILMAHSTQLCSIDPMTGYPNFLRFTSWEVWYFSLLVAEDMPSPREALRTNSIDTHKAAVFLASTTRKTAAFFCNHTIV